MMFTVLLLAIVIGIGVAVTKALSNRRGTGLDRVKGGESNPSFQGERVFLHVLSFAGLMGALYAVSGFLSLVGISLSMRSGTVLGTSDVRARASYYLAALVVGAPLWLGCWPVLQRRLSRTPDERNAFERRLFLGAVFAVCAVVALFGAQGALAAALSFPGAVEHRSNVIDMIAGGAQLLVWGSAWLAYARLGWRERRPSEDDEAHDLAIYVLTGFALSFTVIGLWQGIHEIVNVLAMVGSTTLGGVGHGSWTVWGPIAARVLTGGITWGAISNYDLSRAGRRIWRVQYLFIALVLAAPTAMVGGIATLYEVLRRAFGYTPGGTQWLFLQDALPPLLIGSAFWAYHWALLRRQTPPTRAPRLTIPERRRPAIALLSLAGLAIAGPAFTSLLWLALDALRHSSATLSGGSWWRDGASFGLAAGLVGGSVWLAPWSVLQRAAAADPQGEGATTARRRLIALIVIVSSLAAAGFGVACLWEIFQQLLGAGDNLNTTDWIVKDAAAVVVALVLATYHGRIFRQEGGLRRGTRPTTLRVLALVHPGAEASLAELTRLIGRPIEITGYIRVGTSEPSVGVAELAAQLSELEHESGNATALLILGPSGGTLYAYTRGRYQQPVATADGEVRPNGTRTVQMI